MNVFVTGATGFIGRALCQRISAEGWSLKACIRRASDRDLLPKAAEGVAVGSIDRTPFRQEDFAGVDAVIHLAARVHVMKAEAPDALEAFRLTNVAATERLARAAAAAGVRRFIFISSVKVNGEGQDRAYTENDMPDPKDAYGITKHEAEEALRRIAAETGLEVVILRLPLVYGPGVKANFKRLIRAACLPLPLGSIKNSRSFIYLENLLDVIMLCVQHPRAAGETFFVSDGEDVATPDLVRMIARARGRRALLFPVPVGALVALGKMVGREAAVHRVTASLTVDTGKIRSMLGWAPRFRMEEGIRATVESGL